MKRGYAPIILIAAVLLALVLFYAVRCNPPPVVAPTVTPTFPAPPTVAPTMTATLAPVATKAATQTPQSTEISQITPVHTSTATPSPAPATSIPPTATPDLLGHHQVVRGDTMYDIGLWWYRGQYFAWGVDVWKPICDVNPQIANCRMIYPGDVLAIPVLP